MRTLNLGILAHVDAGKTSLTERLLYAAGVIDEIGSVDDGSTQTDTMALERQRGITIRSAVVSFAIGDVTVNLIDTPGHPDFIAEVERALSVLDGAVLVVSAVEGVQPQTRILMRTLRRLGLPTLIFVNKIDRTGADSTRTLAAIAARLTPDAIPVGTVHDIGTRAAEFHPADGTDARFRTRLVDLLAQHDDGLLAAYVADEETVSYGRLRRALAVQSRQGLVFPVFFGSAITGAGIDCLTEGIAKLLPAGAGDPDAPVAGRVFKVERGAAGEKVAYARLFTGTVHRRDRLEFGRTGEGKVTAIGGFDGSTPVSRPYLRAGEIGKLWGLGDVRIGDTFGAVRPTTDHFFAPPTVETVVEPARPYDRGALHTALTRLAEQDPLINLRQNDLRQELSLSLYGEVQKEVIGATLADEYGLAVTFRESTTICIERLAGTGSAVEVIDTPPNPFLATIGLRLDPAPVGAGFTFRLEIELGSLPLSFLAAIENTARETLGQGLHGWPVPDCTVTLERSGYWPRQSHMGADFDKSMSSTGRDFRHLAPLVLMTALTRAGTTVCEPVHRFRLELPADTIGAVVPVLVRLRGVADTTTVSGRIGVLDGDVPAATVPELAQLLPGLTRGEAALEYSFSHYQPVRGSVPIRPRTDHNPLNRKEYLLHVLRRV